MGVHMHILVSARDPVTSLLYLIVKYKQTSVFLFSTCTQSWKLCTCDGSKRADAEPFFGFSFVQ